MSSPKAFHIKRRPPRQPARPQAVNPEDKKLREARQRIEMLMEEKALEKEYEL